MTFFVELGPRHLDHGEYVLGIAAAKAAAGELDIPTPVVRWFVGPASEATGVKAEQAFDGFESTRSTIGYYAPSPSGIWVRAGLGRAEMVNTVAHETEHARQDHVGDRADKATRERKADRFGERFAAEFLARPNAIKSTLVVADLLDEDGRFEAKALVPGLRSSTDLRFDLGRGRPLIADRIVGLKGERVGAIDDAEALDGEIWLAAQLDKAARYKNLLARLIEQRMVRYAADTVPSFAAPAGKDLGTWPLAFGMLRPAA